MSHTPLFRWLKAGFRAHAAHVLQQDETPLSRRSNTNPVDNGRRAFLKQSARVAAGISVSGLALSTLSQGAYAQATVAPKAAKSRPQDTVMIVGGGIAGLTTAYRLSKLGRPVELFEASPRWGGRMFTRHSFNTQDQFCELGGELIDTGHTDIKALCEEMGLALQDLRETDAGVFYDIFGTLRNDKQLIQGIDPLLIQLQKDLRKAFPDGDVFTPTYQTRIEDYPELHTLDALSLKYYLDHVPGLQPWVQKAIELAYVGEYGLEADEQSALNLILMLPSREDIAALKAAQKDFPEFPMFGASDEAFRIEGGNGRLPNKVAETLHQQNIPLHTDWVLRRIERNHPDDDGYFSLTFTHKDKTITLKTNYLVLAIPVAMLKTIEGLEALELNDPISTAINDMGVGTNTKLMLGFNTRFWRDTQPTAALVYTDKGSQTFWDTSRKQPGSQGILTNFMGGQFGKNASTQHVAKALADLTTVFDKALGPQEINVNFEFSRNTAMMNWSQYRWAKGSYSCPRPGQYTSLVGCFMEPQCDSRLFFAGEHCSIDSMGFMNGAIESANRVSEEIHQTLLERESAC